VGLHEPGAWEGVATWAPRLRQRISPPPTEELSTHLTVLEMAIALIEREIPVRRQQIAQEPDIVDLLTLRLEGDDCRRPEYFRMVSGAGNLGVMWLGDCGRPNAWIAFDYIGDQMRLMVWETGAADTDYCRPCVYLDFDRMGRLRQIGDQIGEVVWERPACNHDCISCEDCMK
jgi:hypothetical protein